MVPMRYGSRYFFQSFIVAPKTFSFMTNLLEYILLDYYYISFKKFWKNNTFVRVIVKNAIWNMRREMEV